MKPGLTSVVGSDWGIGGLRDWVIGRLGDYVIVVCSRLHVRAFPVPCPLSTNGKRINECGRARCTRVLTFVRLLPRLYVRAFARLHVPVPCPTPRKRGARGAPLSTNGKRINECSRARCTRVLTFVRLLPSPRSTNGERINECGCGSTRQCPHPCTPAPTSARCTLHVCTFARCTFARLHVPRSTFARSTFHVRTFPRLHVCTFPRSHVCTFHVRTFACSTFL